MKMSVEVNYDSLSHGYIDVAYFSMNDFASIHIYFIYFIRSIYISRLSLISLRCVDTLCRHLFRYSSPPPKTCQKPFFSSFGVSPLPSSLQSLAALICVPSPSLKLFYLFQKFDILLSLKLYFIIFFQFFCVLSPLSNFFFKVNFFDQICLNR